MLLEWPRLLALGTFALVCSCAETTPSVYQNPNAYHWGTGYVVPAVPTGGDGLDDQLDRIESELQDIHYLQEFKMYHDDLYR
jgi:hypothetical protein